MSERGVSAEGGRGRVCASIVASHFAQAFSRVPSRASVDRGPLVCTLPRLE